MKKGIALFMICTSLIVTGCSAGDVVNQISSNSSATQAPATQAVPTATPGPKETVLAMKETGTVKDWEVRVKKVSVKNKIVDGKIRYFKPGKGKTYLVFSLSVKNKGSQQEQFLPSVGLKNRMMKAVLVDANEKEYKPIQLMAYSKDLLTKSIKPSEKKSGIVVFEVPKKLAKNKDDLELHIGTNQEKLLYSVGK